MPERAAKQLIIVGWSGADWAFIDDMLAEGRLPRLKRLIDAGVRADLATLEPRLSTVLWTSVATGKTADKHGILNSIELDQDGTGLRPASSASRKGKAIWNVLSQTGRRVQLVAWPATHPVEPILGGCVTDLFQYGVTESLHDHWPLLKGSIYPAERALEAAALRVHPNDVPDDILAAFLPNLRQIDQSSPPVRSLRRAVAKALSVHRASLAAAATKDSTTSDGLDCMMVAYDAIESLGRTFMPFHPPRLPHIGEDAFREYRHVMTAAYAMHDRMLGELLDAAEDNASVMVLSAHGFFCDHNRPVVPFDSIDDRNAAESLWHRPSGVLVMSGPPFKRGEIAYGVNVLDITPTALTVLGLHIGADMDGRVLMETFGRLLPVESVLSWDMVKDADAIVRGPSDTPEYPDSLQTILADGPSTAKRMDLAAAIRRVQQQCAFNLAIVFATTGRPNQAIPIFEDLVYQATDDQNYLMGLARCLFQCGRLDQAIDLLRQSLNRNPNSIEPRLFLIGVLATAQRVEEANAELIEAEGQCAGRAELELPMADVQYALGRWAEADRLYGAVRGRDPRNVPALLGLARVAMAQQRTNDAIDRCLDAVSVQHMLPEAHHLLGIALTAKQDFQRAIQSFNVAVSMAPGILDAHRYLASIYRHLGDRENAAKHRVQAEKLIDARSTGRVSAEFFKREAPIRPQRST